MFKKMLKILLGSAADAPTSVASRWLEGGMYVTLQESGSYVPLKILKVDDHGVHIRSYSNAYPELPTQIDEATLFLAGVDRPPDVPLGMGHLPISFGSFAGWDTWFVQQSSVTPDELEGYDMWREAEGGYF